MSLPSNVCTQISPCFNSNPCLETNCIIALKGHSRSPDPFVTGRRDALLHITDGSAGSQTDYCGAVATRLAKLPIELDGENLGGGFVQAVT